MVLDAFSNVFPKFLTCFGGRLGGDWGVFVGWLGGGFGMVLGPFWCDSKVVLG